MSKLLAELQADLAPLQEIHQSAWSGHEEVTAPGDVGKTDEHKETKRDKVRQTETKTQAHLSSSLIWSPTLAPP